MVRLRCSSRAVPEVGHWVRGEGVFPGFARVQ